MPRIVFPFALLVALFVAPVSSACLHFDKRFVGKVEEGTKYALVFHDGKMAHLVIKTDVKAKEGALPKQLSWVLPFPAMPTKYEEASSALLPELAGMTSELRVKSWGAKRAIKVHEVKDVGNYKIQPIEIVGEGGGKELNDWLASNRYNAMPADLQKAYLKKGAVFLAVTLKLDGRDAAIRPLHVTYPAADLTVPLKFSHDDRVFDAVLFVLSSKPIDESALPASHLKLVTQQPFDGKTTRMAELKKLVGERAGFLARIEGRRLNTDGKKLRDLASDPRFAP